MKRLSKILVALLLVLSLFSFVACGGDDDDDGGKNDNPIIPGDGVEGPIIPYD